MSFIFEEPRPMSELGRLFGVFWEPKPVFQDLAARPRWWVPLILMICLALCFVFAISHYIGWDTVLERQFQSNPRIQQLSPAQQQAIIQRTGKFVSISAYAGAALGTPAMMLLVAGMLLLLFRTVAGAEVSFRQAFSFTSYSFLPTGLSTILAIVVVSFVHPADFDVENPLALNLGWLVDSQTAPKWLYSLATSVDFFVIWLILLLALGFSVAAKRLSYKKSLTLVVSAWLVLVLIKAGWRSMFG